MISETCAAIADLLNADGINYTVFLQTSVVSPPGDRSSEELVRAALGSSSLIGGIQDVPSKEMVDEVRASLSYAGDAGAGPGPGVVQSTRFNTLLDTLTADLQALASRAAAVEQFWLKAGHPAYPVFWDFAFLVRNTQESVVIVGSSSD